MIVAGLAMAGACSRVGARLQKAVATKPSPQSFGRNYALRVCTRCMKRSEFNPMEPLKGLAANAQQLGLPVPVIERGPCIGACPAPPVVRFVNGPKKRSILVDGMSKKEKDSRSFVGLANEAEVERVFLLARQHISHVYEAELSR